ncbi:hypothetical protein AB0M28_18470 [Streptomyces sp. NPDC051940]|uniref:hypothetical protein n=1 Tax=Streptomyces sp. NPDC051940 TaxID=3155675 RepID=UPI003431C00E
MSMEELTEDELAEMEARVARASAGPWVPVLETQGATGGASCIQLAPDTTDLDDGEMYLSRFVNGRQTLISPNAQLDADLDFIASAREDVPRLISEVRRLQAMLRTTGA